MAFKEDKAPIKDEGRTYYVDELFSYGKVYYVNPELRKKYVDEILVEVSQMQPESRDD